jgi:hypothetical protein
MRRAKANVDHTLVSGRDLSSASEQCQSIADTMVQ